MWFVSEAGQQDDSASWRQPSKSHRAGIHPFCDKRSQFRSGKVNSKTEKSLRWGVAMVEAGGRRNRVRLEMLKPECGRFPLSQIPVLLNPTLISAIATYRVPEKPAWRQAFRPRVGRASQSFNLRRLFECTQTPKLPFPSGHTRSLGSRNAGESAGPAYSKSKEATN